MKIFQDWLKESSNVLKEWQKDAALAFLSQIENQQKPGTGKTFLLKLLSEFINTYGNDFGLEKEKSNWAKLLDTPKRPKPNHVYR